MRPCSPSPSAPAHQRSVCDSRVTCPIVRLHGGYSHQRDPKVLSTQKHTRPHAHVWPYKPLQRPWPGAVSVTRTGRLLMLSRQGGVRLSQCFAGSSPTRPAIGSPGHLCPEQKQAASTQSLPTHSSPPHDLKDFFFVLLWSTACCSVFCCFLLLFFLSWHCCLLPLLALPSWNKNRQARCSILNDPFVANGFPSCPASGMLAAAAFATGD